MPSTVIYKSGFPSATRPVETSASVGLDGLITGFALFIMPSGSLPFAVNASISASLFPYLAGVQIQGLFIDSISLEKRNGINYTRINVAGVINNPPILKKSEWSARSFSKTQQFVGQNNEESEAFLSFDYYSETVTVSTISLKNSIFDLSAPDAKFGEQYNVRGISSLTQIVGPGLPPPLSIQQLVGVFPRQITNKNIEERGRLVFTTVTKQAVYE